MKKTIQINLNNKVYHLDEDAFDILNDYLNKIRENAPGRTRDEEQRISLIFDEKLSNLTQVITLKDVNEAINEEPKAERKEQTQNMHRQKKLYRDIDHHVIGGVCSGLANYFGTDPVLLRVIFILLLIFSGFGLLAYLILWIAMPPALTIQQKDEMHGSRFNYDEIRSNVKNEYGRVKSNMKDMAGSPASQQITTFFRSIFVALGNILGVLFRVFGILLATLLIIFIVGLFFSIFSFMPFHIPHFHFPHINLPHFWNFNIHWPFDFPDVSFTGFILAFVLLIPIISIIIWIIKGIFGIRKSSFTFRLTIFIFWILSVLYLASNLYDEKEQVSAKYSGIITGDTLTSVVNDEQDMDENDHFGFQLNGTWYYLDTDDEIAYIRPDIEYFPSYLDSISIVIQKEAYELMDSHHEITDDITYHFSIEGNKLHLDEYAKTDIEHVASLPSVKVKVLVPQNIFIKKSMPDSETMKGNHN